MTGILIEHPNRLGDHLICAGLVREFCKKYDRVGIFSVPKYHSSVSYLFRDIPNLTIEVCNTHRDKQLFLLRNRLHLTKRHYAEVKHIFTDQELGVLFERQYYARMSIPFEKKWDSFHLERDREREEALFKKVVPSMPYAFVHDDNRYPMKPEKLPNMPLVRPVPGVTDNFFDWALVIERAAEVHAIDSSFMFLTDLLPFDSSKQKLMVHRYSRQPNVLWNMPVLKKAWQILT